MKRKRTMLGALTLSAALALTVCSHAAAQGDVNFYTKENNLNLELKEQLNGNTLKQGSYAFLGTAKYKKIYGQGFYKNAFDGSLTVGSGTQVIIMDAFPYDSYSSYGSSSKIAGLSLVNGNFTLNGGFAAISATNGGKGLVLENGNVNISGPSSGFIYPFGHGPMVAVASNTPVMAYDSASGMYGMLANTLFVNTSSNGTGILLKDGNINQNGGNVVVQHGQGTEIKVNGDYNKSNGTLLIMPNYYYGPFAYSGKSKNENPAIYVKGDFNHTGGNLLAFKPTYNNDPAIKVKGDFNFTNGLVWADRNTIAVGGKNSDGGNFNQTGGILFLANIYNDKGSSVNAKNAYFGEKAIIAPVVSWDNYWGYDLRSGGDSTIRGNSGKMYVKNIDADSSARIIPFVQNSIHLQIGETIKSKTDFLQSGKNKLDLTETNLVFVENSLTMSFNPNAERQSFKITRNAWLSDYTKNDLYGALVKTFEDFNNRYYEMPPAIMARSGDMGNAYILFDYILPMYGIDMEMAYSLGDMATNRTELQQYLSMIICPEFWYAANPVDTTRLAAFSQTYMDASQNVFWRNFNAQNPQGFSLVNTNQTEAAEFTTNSGKLNDWTMWFAPLGGFENYSGKEFGFGNSSISYTGVSIGSAMKWDTVSFGLAFHGLIGDIDGSRNYTADTSTLGLTAGMRLEPFKTYTFAPWLELGAAYAYTSVDQERKSLGFEYDSEVDVNAFRLSAQIGNDFYFRGLRLTPQVGVDYTYTRQNGYSEDFSSGPTALKVSSATTKSLRPQIGMDLGYDFTERFSANAYGFYRYETLDRATDLGVRTPFIGYAYKTEGEKRDRSSGNLGLGANYQATNSLNFFGGYDFTLGDHYNGHQFHLGMGWNF